MRTARFWVVINAVKQTPPPCSQLEDFDKIGFLENNYLWGTTAVLKCQRKTPQVLNHFIKLWAGFTDCSSLSPVCPVVLSQPTALRRFQIIWKDSVLFAIWRLRSQFSFWVVPRASQLLSGKGPVLLKKYLTTIILPFFSSAPVLPYVTSCSKLQSLANHFKRKSSFMFWIAVNLPGWSKIIVFII